MAKKDTTPLTPKEKDEIIRQLKKMVRAYDKAIDKAIARKKLRRWRQKYAHPGAQNLSIPRKSLIKPTGKPSVGKKRIQKAEEDSRS